MTNANVKSSFSNSGIGFINWLLNKKIIMYTNIRVQYFFLIS